MESVIPILEFKKTCVSYTKQTMAVKYVSAAIERNTITAIMGPSGCGKSTLLRAVNLMHNLYQNIRVDGEILLNGENILLMEPIEVRRRVGMVFQRPAPFPTMSIYDNVLSGFSLNGIKLSKAEKDTTVERCLKSVALWDEVKDVLNKKGTFLSGGQQQRLCIARALAMKPRNETYRGTFARSSKGGYHLDSNPQYGAGKAHIVKIDVYVFGGTC